MDKASVEGARLATSDALADIGAGDGSRFSELRRRWLEHLASHNEPRLSNVIIIRTVQAMDALVVFACGLVLHQAYVSSGAPGTLGTYLAVALGAGLGVAAILAVTGSYRLNRLSRGLSQFIRLAAAVSSVFILLLAGAFFFKVSDQFSRVWLAGWYGLSIAGLAGFRLAVAAILHHWQRKGYLTRRVVLVGGGEPAADIIAAIQDSAIPDVEVAGIFDDRHDQRSPDIVAGLPRLGSVSELTEFARRYRVDMLVLTLPLTAEQRLLQIIRQLWVLPVDIRLSAQTQKLRYRPRAYSWLGNVPLIDVFDRPLRDWDEVVKMLEDKILASLALVALSPVMALVALAIKLDSKGPALFRQKRYGFNNELIEVYKFRSMYTEMCDADARKLVTKDDPRVTRVGRFIRKTSLDELPQLFNVLKGELSLVGPRPHATHAKAKEDLYQNVVEGYYARHKVKPGITGWAQIHGWRGETDTHEKILRRVEHDLFYIENWSLLLDLYILVKTPFALLKGENAY